MLFLLLMPCLLQRVGRAQVLSDEVIGYYDATWVNCNTWRQFDLMMHIESVADTGRQEIFTETSVLRYVVDFDDGKFFVAGMSTYSSSLHAPGGKVEAVKFSGLVSNGAASRKFVFPSKPHSFTGSALVGLSSLQIPDPRCVGLAKFPVLFYPDPADPGFERIVASGQLLNPAQTNVLSDGTVEFEVFRPFTTKTRFGTCVTKYQYSLDSLMPKRHSATLAIESAGMRKSFPQFAEVYEWRKLKNIFVPERILQDSVGFYDAPKGLVGTQEIKDGERFNLQTTVTFHWFSLNDVVDDTRFALSSIDNVAEVRRLLDPALSNAESIKSLGNNSTRQN